MARYPMYTQAQRNLILHTLSSDQKEFIELNLKRSRKDVFDTNLARDKGEESINIQDEDEWGFSEYNYDEDQNLKCECGRSLKHQFVVINKSTGVIRKFGKDHFHIHTGIPKQIVNDILKGFGKIDYDLDELLYKVKCGWNREVLKRATELKIKIPKEIQKFLNVQLPLLDKYIDTIYELVLKEENEQMRKRRLEAEKEERKRLKIEQDELKARKKAEKNLKIKIELSPYDPSNPYALDKSLQEPVYNKLLELKTASTRVLCQELNIFDHSHQGEYITGKPKIYPYVVNYLEELVFQGKCKLVSGDTIDRLYTIDF